MRFRKFLSVILILSLSATFFACQPSSSGDSTVNSVTLDTEATEEKSIDTDNESNAAVESKPIDTDETETVTEETEYVEKEAFEDFVSFADTASNSTTKKELRKNGSYAVSFTVPEGYMTSLALNLWDSAKPVETQLVIRIYKFDGNYETSVEGRALRTEYVESIMRTYTMWFGKEKMPAGDYLAVVSSTATEQAESIKVGTLWLPNTLPAEYEPYNLVNYVDGKPSKKGNALYGGFTYVHDVPVKEVEPLSGDPCTEGKAKVIVIGGQSNAVGSTNVSFLINNIGKEKYDEYSKGIDNVKILYRCTTTSNTDLANSAYSEDFVPVKPGQGISAGKFGPELGLAVYLNEHYPDETFYIIKHAIGGASMAGYWNLNDETRQKGLALLKDTIDDGLALLKEDGLEPEILAFFWMQGESDGGSFPGAYKYYELQTKLAEHLRETYADFAAPRGIAFIDGAASDSGYWNCYMAVNYSKRLFRRDSLLNYYIDTNAMGLTTLYENNDPAHYDSMSMMHLGELVGECLTEILTP